MERKTYPSEISDDEWAFVTPYLTLVTEDARQRVHSLREVFNGLRWIVRAGYHGAKRKLGSKVHVAVDTLGQLLALHVTPADEQDRAQLNQ